MNGLYVVEEGEGTPLFCLHGIGSSSTSFAGQMSELSARWRVVAWDAPGYGHSADLHDPNGLGDFAQAAITVLEGLGRPAHLLGVSWGGVIATEVAIERPDLLRSLILIGASRGSGRDAASAATIRSRSDELETFGADRFARLRAAALVSPTAPPALIDTVAETMAAGVRPSGYRATAEAMATTDLGPRLGLVTLPSLVLCGSEDDVTGLAESRHLAHGIPESVLVCVRGAGHLVNQESAESVNYWISAFVEIVDGNSNHRHITELAWT